MAAEQKPFGRLHTSQVHFSVHLSRAELLCAPEPNVILKSKRERREAKTAESRCCFASQNLESKTARAETPGERRGRHPAEVLTPLSTCGLHGKGFTHPSSGFLPGKRASPCLIFWGHLFAYICPTPRKQMRAYMRIRSATPALCTGILGRAAGSPSLACLDSKCTRCQQIQPQTPRRLFESCLLLRWCRHLSM